jgi:hypothetical protein
MVSLLTEGEAAIRRSASSRLVVETLLLRWTLMDRTVDLEEVLRARGAGSGPGPDASAGGSGPVRQRTERPPPPAPPPGPSSAGPVASPVTLASLTAAWPAVAARAREQSPLLGTVVEHLRPVGVDGRTITLAVDRNASHMIEGARRQQPAIADLLRPPGEPAPTVRVVEGGGSVGAGDRPKRLSDSELRAIKLQEIRAKDAALDAAADALDLEIVD